MQESSISVYVLVAMGSSGLLTVALLSNKGGNKIANRLLAALTFTISIVVGGAVLLSTKYVFLFPHLSRLHHPFAFLGAPLVFLYLRVLTRNEERFETKDFLHFIPFALCLIYLLPYYTQSGEEKLKIVVSEYVQESMGHWYYVRSALFIVQSLVYLIVIAAVIITYSRGVKDRTSPSEKAILFRVRFFVIAFLSLWLGALLRYALDQTARTNLLVPLGASALVYAIGYMEMARRPAITANAEKPAAAKKYEKSTLTSDRSEQYLQRLVHLMEHEKVFTDDELTLQKVAEKLSIPAHHLSQTINERLGQTFSDFINSYRVEEAKKRLLDPAKSHYSLLAIAEEAGFNSKSSFNAVFKKHVNMTPSEFRKIAGRERQPPDLSRTKKRPG